MPRIRRPTCIAGRFGRLHPFRSHTHDRSDALRALQRGEIDCLVGVNLLREGLDLPQVSLVAILNADSEGFLRSGTALLQTIGRMKMCVYVFILLNSYSHRLMLRLRSMKKCIDATKNQRQFQIEYNAKHGKEMKSTQGSSVLTIFDLLKDQIEAALPEETTSEIRNAKGFTRDHITLLSSPLALHRTEGCIDIVTDHVPSKPGVYFWKDADGNILYIRKAKRLRSRVKSYLSPMANHSY